MVLEDEKPFDLVSEPGVAGAPPTQVSARSTCAGYGFDDLISRFVQDTRGREKQWREADVVDEQDMGTRWCGGCCFVKLHCVPDDAKEAEDLEVEPAEKSLSTVRPETIESGLEDDSIDD